MREDLAKPRRFAEAPVPKEPDWLLADSRHGFHFRQRPLSDPGRQLHAREGAAGPNGSALEGSIALRVALQANQHARGEGVSLI
jgi:hypothetical protein